MKLECIAKIKDNIKDCWLQVGAIGQMAMNMP